MESNRHHFPYSCRDYLCVSLVSLNTEFTTSHRDSEITLYSVQTTQCRLSMVMCLQVEGAWVGSQCGQQFST